MRAIEWPWVWASMRNTVQFPCNHQILLKEMQGFRCNTEEKKRPADKLVILKWMVYLDA